jgi:hypothetical protein
VTALQHVHVRVTDAATGKPTPCRVRFTDATGAYYAPLGRLTSFATQPGVDVGGSVIADNVAFAYIDGACEILLPPGAIHVEVHKGPEYMPLVAEHSLLAGKLALRLTIERWADSRAEGWYSGDIRCHQLSPQAALLEGQAEDLAVVNVLAKEVRSPGTEYAALPNLLEFSGQMPAAQSPGCLVAVNTLNEHPWLGRLGLLHCHRIVHPLRFGEADFDDWTLAAWCDQCHRKAGLVAWPPEGSGGEALVNAVLGKIDAIEVERTVDSALAIPEVWWALAGIGIPLGLTAGSGKDSNKIVLGSARTYAHLAPGEAFSYKAWIEAVRARRTFVTAGPLLKLSVAGRDPGGLVQLAEPEQPIEIRAEASCATMFDRLILHWPGGTTPASGSGSPARAVIEETRAIREAGWVYATCHDSQNRLLAMTSPTQVRISGRPPFADAAAAHRLAGLVRQSRGRIEVEGRFSGAIHRQRFLSLFDAALERLATA